MDIRVPEFSMVMMMGPTGSGKTTLARKYFRDTEIISSDQCRAMVADDPQAQEATQAAFHVLHTILKARLSARRLTVVDSTNLRAEHRRILTEIAREHDCQVTLIGLDTPAGECLRRNGLREDRQAPERVVRSHCREMHQARRGVRREGFGRVHVLTPQDAEEAIVTRMKMRTDLRDQAGPFDIIGDVHGCHDELMKLLHALGYHLRESAGMDVMEHPDGRRAIFLGDLCDRGPASDRVLETVMAMVKRGSALCIRGNHDDKLGRSLHGNKVEVTHGLELTLAQLERRSPEFRESVQEFLAGLPEHYLLDGGRLAVAHAGILEAYQGRASRRVRDFCLYGQTTGESDGWGLPVRHDWAQEYRGEALVVYGHTAVEEARWFNNTICLDTGCVFGGSLTAMRYPERELLGVQAQKTYYEGVRPWAENPVMARESQPGTLSRLKLADVTGRMEIETETHGRIVVREEQARAALETMSRFATDPRWLIYLPPTISPSETSDLPGLLEHPREVFRQYQEDGVARVICEEKHMGSRGIIIVGRNPGVIRDRFQIESPAGGTCYSRTGRQFFPDATNLEPAFIQRVREAAGGCGLWDELDTDWLLMDCEIMPWSLKARGLIDRTYAPVGAAAENTLGRVSELLAQARERGMPTGDLEESTLTRLDAVRQYRAAYGRYCWNTDALENIRVAPFLVLAGEQGLVRRDHGWHMEAGRRLARQDPGLFQATMHITVEPGNEVQEAAATQWWTGMTRDGGEGMVVKPVELMPRGKHDRVQPAVKVRGPEYLRIIYGPEYNLPGNLERMRRRSLRGKRDMAIREFALGLEGLRRFTAREPLRLVHQCAFAVMALESQPMDPRL